MKTAATITFARGARQSAPLAKIVRLRGGQIIDVEPAPQAGLHRFRQVEFASLAELMAAVEDAAHKGEIAIRAEPLAEVGRRALYDDPEAGPAGLREAPRSWVALDWDHLEIDPAPDLTLALEDLADPAEHCNWATPDPLLDPTVGVRAALLLLPPPFRKAACGWQISASAGFKPGFRLRTWHLLDHPCTGAELQHWLAPPIVDAVLDPVTLRAAQPHYLAITFVGGSDPCPQRFGILEHPGGNLVQVPDLASTIRREQEAVSRARRVAARRRPRTVGHDDSGSGFLQRCVDTVRSAVDGTKHLVYLHEAARAKAFCDRHSVAWSPWKQALQETYETSLPAGEADRRRRGSIVGVMKWVEARA